VPLRAAVSKPWVLLSGQNGIDLRWRSRFAPAMRMIKTLVPLAIAMLMAACSSTKEAKFADLPGGPSPSNPVVKPANAISGKVVSYNRVGRFAVLNFPVTQMPAVGQALPLFRDGLKVGEVKITGPQKDDNIIADLLKGEAQVGDQVRDR
jgi:hypothetical protein